MIDLDVHRRGFGLDLDAELGAVGQVVTGEPEPVHFRSRVGREEERVVLPDDGVVRDQDVVLAPTFAKGVELDVEHRRGD